MLTRNGQVGNEFSSVEALWSQFENVMAKDPEEAKPKDEDEDADADADASKDGTTA